MVIRVERELDGGERGRGIGGDEKERREVMMRVREEMISGDEKEKEER